MQELLGDVDGGAQVGHVVVGAEAPAQLQPLRRTQEALARPESALVLGQGLQEEIKSSSVIAKDL